ncbi:unnamed protein product, partial [Dovyalis caffra]
MEAKLKLGLDDLTKLGLGRILLLNLDEARSRRATLVVLDPKRQPKKERKRL